MQLIGGIKLNYRNKYELWINSPEIDEKTKVELKNIIDETELEDRFYKDLEFGTGGLKRNNWSWE